VEDKDVFNHLSAKNKFQTQWQPNHKRVQTPTRILLRREEEVFMLKPKPLLIREASFTRRNTLGRENKGG
jgi:hypothetical protein